MGVSILGTSTSNFIIRNNIYSNTNNGVFINSALAKNNFILTNIIWGQNQINGIYISGAKQNSIISNSIYNHKNQGILIDGGSSKNTINLNYFKQNIANGLSLNNSSTNKIINNQILQNGSSGIRITSGNSISNYIIGNNIRENVTNGIYLSDTTKNSIYSNSIGHMLNYYAYGIYIIGAAGYNLISKNIIYSNTGTFSYGIVIFETGGFDIISMNRIFKIGDHAIELDQGNNIKVFRNAIYNNTVGFLIDSANNIDVINNDFYGSTWSALYNNFGAGNIRVYNNIFFYNPGGWVDDDNLTMDLGYNIIFSNGTTYQYIGVAPHIHNGNITNINPMINISNYAFTIKSPLSPCVDQATNIPYVDTPWNGNGPDIGWLESSFTYIYLGPFFVATNGNDANYGTFTAPFRHVQKAATAMVPNNTISSCYIYPGIFQEQVRIYSNHSANGFMVFTKLSNNNHPTLFGAFATNNGYWITNTSRVMIQGLNIKGFKNGISLLGTSSSNFIMRNNIYSNTNYGVYINSASANNNFILTNILWGQNQIDGIYISSANQNSIISNTIHGHKKQGIYLDGSASKNNIIHNLIFSNIIAGITINSISANYNSILYNNLEGNYQGNGMLIQSANNINIRSNQIHQNQFGISLTSGAATNFIVINSIYSNNLAGILVNTNAKNNYIFTNTIWGINQAQGIRLKMGNNNIIQHNTIFKNATNGLWLTASTNNMIRNNTILNNPIGLLYESSLNSIYLNTISSNTNAVKVLSGSFNLFTKNNLNNNRHYGFCNQSTPLTITNNWWGTTKVTQIITKISNNGGDTNFIKYRLYGPFNILENTATDPLPRISWVTSYVTNLSTVCIRWRPTTPVNFAHYNVYQTTNLSLWSNLSFQSVVTEVSSVNITNILRNGLDTGTYHFYITSLDTPNSIYSNESWYSIDTKVTIIYSTMLTISKSISNVQLNNKPVFTIPGSTVTFKITYSNMGIVNGRNVVIYDKIPSHVTFVSNLNGSATNWQIQYSTNTNPTQDYNSTQYSNGYISKNNIKWIRWKKASVGAAEGKRSMVYTVVIK